MTILRLGSVFVSDLDGYFDLVIVCEDNGMVHRVYDGAQLSDDDFRDYKFFDFI